ncbi:MAG TPA: LLM class flavin-dependent oxidoreductase, partial [Candidatus Limnocylindria bacterium]|nr:LLM class flavin-dependent oxidoreductase [Candidatus Limnocylindria bacterium]
MLSPDTRPFRFGVMVNTRDATRDTTLELAMRAEAAGISILLGTDHLGRWSSLPLLQLAAEHTGLRVGTAVINNELRHPALLAQELATLDLVTDGRLEVGIGAGWDRSEMEAVGMVFQPPPRRVDRLEASVRLLKQALGEGRIERPADAAYPAMRLDGMPRSVQRPHPPILVGGGRRRLLQLAAREANIVALDPRSLPDGG